MPTGYSAFAAANVETVVLSDDDGGIYPHRVTVRDRVSARMLADRWYHALARGTAPESSAPLSLHAQVLVSPSCRRRLAASLTRILDDARDDHAPDWNALGPRRHHAHVLDARDEIDTLVARLLAPVPVSGRGVALVRLLLTDGGGPLYRRTSAADLAERLGQAARALDPLVDPAG